MGGRSSEWALLQLAAVDPAGCCLCAKAARHVAFSLSNARPAPCPPACPPAPPRRACLTAWAACLTSVAASSSPQRCMQVGAACPACLPCVLMQAARPAMCAPAGLARVFMSVPAAEFICAAAASCPTGGSPDLAMRPLPPAWPLPPCAPQCSLPPSSWLAPPTCWRPRQALTSRLHACLAGAGSRGAAASACMPRAVVPAAQRFLPSAACSAVVSALWPPPCPLHICTPPSFPSSPSPGAEDAGQPAGLRA